jgi:hypothetical protein
MELLSNTLPVLFLLSRLSTQSRSQYGSLALATQEHLQSTVAAQASNYSNRENDQ